MSIQRTTTTAQTGLVSVVLKNLSKKVKKKMERMQLLEDLFHAYYDARKNKRNTINQLRFEVNMEQELFALCDDLLDSSYVIRPSICFIVNVPVKREIFAADFRDRVVHHLLFNYINPVFELSFIKDSYSCRKGKGTQYGIARINSFIRACSENYTKDCYILKLDIQGYFMSINKEILLKSIYSLLERKAEYYSYKQEPDWEMVDNLLRQVVMHDSTKNCKVRGQMSEWEGLSHSKSLFCSPNNCGLPIGNLTSQLFSNVYLNSFDHYMKDTLKLDYYGRYVDDFIVIHESKEYLKDVKENVNDFFTKRLHLQLHPRKMFLQHYAKGVAFLGTYIKPNRIYIGNRTKNNFFRTVQETDNLLSNTEVSKTLLFKVRASINSYLGIMRHYNTYKLRKKILLSGKHQFFQYGFLSNRLKKYQISKRHLCFHVERFMFIFS